MMVLVLVLGLAASVGHADKDKAKASYRRGMAAFVLNQFDDAIVEFEAGFREEPEAAFLYNIAQAHAKAGRPVRAIEFYRKYLELAGDAALDRVQVEARVEELRKESAAPAPAPALTPPQVAPAPAVAVVAAPAPAAPTPRRRQPAWVWAVVGVAAVVVVGGVVGGVVAGTTPVNAPAHAGTEREQRVQFP